MKSDLLCWRSESCLYLRCVQSLTHECTLSCLVVSDSVRPHGLVCHAPLPMELSRQKYWS